MSIWAIERSSRGGSVVLSPHADDAALSIGCLLAQDSHLRPALLATVFSCSSFAPLSDRCGPTDVSRLRSSEDRQFARTVGCEIAELGYEEALVRMPAAGLASAFGEPSGSDDDLVDALVWDVVRLIEEIEPQYLLAPRSVGGHIDHIVVRRVAEQVAAIRDVDVLLYDDQPYTALGDVVSSEFAVREDCSRFHEENISAKGESRAAKTLHASIYASQPAAARVIELVAERVPGFFERLWLCEAD